MSLTPSRSRRKEIRSGVRLLRAPPVPRGDAWGPNALPSPALLPPSLSGSFEPRLDAVQWWLLQDPLGNLSKMLISGNSPTWSEVKPREHACRWHKPASISSSSPSLNKSRPLNSPQTYPLLPPSLTRGDGPFSKPTFLLAFDPNLLTLRPCSPFSSKS